MSAVRYTAILKVVRVDSVAPPPRGNVPGKDHTEDTEVANMVIRAKSLPKLVAAIRGHLELVEDTE